MVWLWRLFYLLQWEYPYLKRQSLSVFTKIIWHIGHFRWLGPNVWWEILQIWIEYTRTCIKPIRQMSDESWKFSGTLSLYWNRAQGLNVWRTWQELSQQLGGVCLRCHSQHLGLIQRSRHYQGYTIATCTGNNTPLSLGKQNIKTRNDDKNFSSVKVFKRKKMRKYSAMLL